MKIKIERKEKPTKQKKTPTIKVGTHHKLTTALWTVLIISIIFGIYKNFTAIDQHTTHETKVIEQKLVDTNKVESFVKEFATGYFSWQQSQESIDKRNEWLKNYITKDLQQLNSEMIRADIPTTSTVQQVQIWSVDAKEELNYVVLFSVNQLITESDKKTAITSTYQTTVHMDKAGNLVIIQNPTISSKPQKSEYEPKAIESDGTVDADVTAEVTTFLETFFKLYPKATDKELAYYVSNDALPVINKNYVFVELVNPIYLKKDNQVKVIVSVKYLDQETKTPQISQYKLNLDKAENWKIY
ncbi:conjugal transfer protein [Listeria monocytogenes]|nr:conjugal transfer protein [Listeria monocytogenes]